MPRLTRPPASEDCCVPSSSEDPRGLIDGTRSAFLPILVGLLTVGCTIVPSGSDMPPPNADAILVFYPSGTQLQEGLVLGLGRAGAVPPEFSHVQVESFPTGNSAVVPVESDGRFAFRIAAISGDILEFRGATSAQANILGAPVFLRVPPSIEPVPSFICCPDTNTCQTEFDRDNQVPCPPPSASIVTCFVDADCGIFENEFLPLREDQLSVSPPNDLGLVTVEGQVVPNVLVTLDNRGKSTLAVGVSEEEARRRGLLDPGIQRTIISDENGQFRFESVPAIADDELILQLFDLRGFRSPPYAFLVPDPELVGVDVLDVFPWQPLTAGETGRVAIRIVPFGADGRGICPNDLSDPDGLELCVSGGLRHEMITFTSAQLDQQNDPAFALNPVESPTDTNTPHNRGIEGHVRAQAQRIFLVLDMSLDAELKDPNRLAFTAIRSYVRFLRSSDKVGIVTFADQTTVWTQPTLDRQLLDATLLNISQSRREGSGTLFDGVTAAANNLSTPSERNPGRIVLVTFAPPAGTPEEARSDLDRVLDLVVPNQREAFEGFKVDVVGVQIEPLANTLLELEELATFSQGQFVSVDAVTSLETSLANLRGEQVGSFLLLYSMSIPAGVGKAGTVFLDLEVQIPGSAPSSTRYQGPLRIANAP